MSRRFISLGLALAVVVTMLGVASMRPAGVDGAPALTISPWSEDSHQKKINVRGTDFGRNANITGSVVVPGGRRIALPNIQADASGNFWSTFSVYHDLRLVNVGIYWAQYCIAGTSNCWNVSFKIG